MYKGPTSFQVFQEIAISYITKKRPSDLAKIKEYVARAEWEDFFEELNEAGFHLFLKREYEDYERPSGAASSAPGRK